MNYYPYMMPMINAPVKKSLFSSLFQKINFSSILNGTNKVLDVANKTLPLIKQVKPVVKNAKTMFNIMNEFKKTDLQNNKKNFTQTIQKKEEKINTNKNSSLTFFQ